jgi:hypothetical protein
MAVTEEQSFPQARAETAGGFQNAELASRKYARDALRPDIGKSSETGKRRVKPA